MEAFEQLSWLYISSADSCLSKKGKITASSSLAALLVVATMFGSHSML